MCMPIGSDWLWLLVMIPWTDFGEIRKYQLISSIGNEWGHFGFTTAPKQLMLHERYKYKKCSPSSTESGHEGLLLMWCRFSPKIGHKPRSIDCHWKQLIFKLLLLPQLWKYPYTFNSYSNSFIVQDISVLLRQVWAVGHTYTHRQTHTHAHTHIHAHGAGKFSWEYCFPSPMSCIISKVSTLHL